MRLTVGPLPPAVYWRRRMLVLGGLLLVVLVIVYACTGGPPAGGSAAPSPGSSASATPADSASASPAPTAFTLPVNTPTTAATAGCTDDEIGLTAAATPATVHVSNGQVGPVAEFTLKIRNISTRTCVRDIGSVPQELQLRTQDGTVIWSSDDCHPAGYDDYSKNQTLTPGWERSYTVSWNGYRTRSDVGSPTCEPSATSVPSAGGYELVARLGTKLSATAPVAISISIG
ncbi:MAG TPA: hypothetical protein VH561_12485 [Micromonosporaceae bacterium]|jgi:hypothetical protein